MSLDKAPQHAAPLAWPHSRPPGKRRLVVAPRVTAEAPGIVRKRGQEFRLRRELEAMEFVRQQTSIPIPRVLQTHLDAHEDYDNNWFLMEDVRGAQLGTAWPAMTEQARSRTLMELKGYLGQLQRIHPPGKGWIGSISRGPAYDHRIDNMATCGPFDSVGEFHDYLIAPVKACPKPERALKYKELLPDTYAINFAHADLSWENILIEPETGEVTAILDWEMAGFWPEWWEYRKALSGSRSQLWWMSLMKEITQAFSIETDADMDIEMY